MTNIVCDLLSLRYCLRHVAERLDKVIHVGLLVLVLECFNGLAEDVLMVLSPVFAVEQGSLKVESHHVVDEFLVLFGFPLVSVLIRFELVQTLVD